MQTKKNTLKNFLFPLLLMLLALILSAEKTEAQVNTLEKCVELSLGVEKFYKECPNEDFLKSFSPKIYDKFGIITLEDELARLDAFKQELNGNFDSVGYVVVYGGKANKFGEIKARVKRITDCLINNLKIDSKRLKVIQGGFRETFEFELWTSTIKDNFPPLSPTVDAEKVRFRGKMKPLPTIDY